MPEYFEDIATEHLLGEGIQPEELNQYMFGDCLEAIAAYGPTRLFTGITLNIMKQIKFGSHRLHYDTTTINVTGEYDQSFNTRLIEIVRGHSKDHRNDLKQFIISLVTNQHGIPLFMEPLSGNISDKKPLSEQSMRYDKTWLRMKPCIIWQILLFTLQKVSHPSEICVFG